MLVSNGAANGNDCQRNNAGNHDACMAMPAKTECQRDNADRDDHDQHLNMQMVVAELTKERQDGNGEWQSKAVHEAQAGQRNRYLVQDFRRSGTVIHRHLPIC